jgi:hypothetical protein
MLRQEAESTHRPWYMLPPESLPRKLWDTAALLIIYATLITVPLQMGG